MKPLGSLAVIKIILSILIIVGLAEISKRVSPQTGGIIAGLPLGTGLSVYFISYEQGTDFAINGIPWGIGGLSASIIFCLMYLLIGRVNTPNRLLSIVYPSAAGIFSFFTVGIFLFLLQVNVFQAAAIFLVVFAINLFIVNKLMRAQEKAQKSASTLPQLIFRGAAVGVILLFITGVAAFVGSKWAGILSSFPSTLFPLLLVLHYEEGNELFPYVIYGFSYSVSTLLVFYLSYLYVVPICGLNIGFLLVYGICVIYLLVFRKIQTVFRPMAHNG